MLDKCDDVTSVKLGLHTDTTDSGSEHLHKMQLNVVFSQNNFGQSKQG